MSAYCKHLLRPLRSPRSERRLQGSSICQRPIQRPHPRRAEVALTRRVFRRFRTSWVGSPQFCNAEWAFGWWSFGGSVCRVRRRDLLGDLPRAVVAPEDSDSDSDGDAPVQGELAVSLRARIES